MPTDSPRIPSLVLSLLLLAPALPAQQIGNGTVALNYTSDALLGVELTQISNAATGVTIALAEADAWELVFRRVSDGVLQKLRPSQLSGESVSIVQAPSADELTVTWTAPAQGQIPALVVELKARALPGDDVITFNLSADPAASAALSLYRMELLLGADPLNDPATETLASPLYLGALFFNPLNNLQVAAVAATETTPSDPEGAPSHPGLLSMQWSAYYRKDPGGAPGPMLWWGTRDLDDNLKPYQLETCRPNPSACAGQAMMFGVQHYPANNLHPAGAPVALPFPAVLTALRGDWYDAARYYRSWVIAQNAPWVAQGPMTANAEFSQHVLDCEAIGTFLPGRCEAPSLVGPAGPGASKAPASETHGERPSACDPGFDYGFWDRWADQMSSVADELDIDNILQRVQLWDYNSNLNLAGDWFPIRPDFQTAAPLMPAQFPFAPYFESGVYHQSAAGYSSSYVAGHLGVSVANYTSKRENGAVLAKEAPLVDRTQPCGARICDVVSSVDLLCYGTDFPRDYTLHVNEPLVALGASGAFFDQHHLDPRLCYDSNHISGGDHPEGDGRYWPKGKRQVLADLKAAMRAKVGGDPEYYLITEGVSEAYLSQVELTWNRYGGFLTSKAANVARVPLFQTVYNDYQMTGSTQVIALQDPSSAHRNRSLRQAFGSHVFQGGEPFAGAVISGLTLTQQLADPAYAQVGLSVELIKNCMDVLKLDAARELIVFGQRLRDPVTDSPLVDLSVHELSVEQPGSWLQPFVYAAVFGDPSIPRVGVLLINWTHEDDPIAPVGPGAPGDQLIGVKLDLAKYGFSAGVTYDLQLITSFATGPVGSYTYPGGAPTQLFSVPELSAVLSIIGPAAGP